MSKDSMRDFLAKFSFRPELSGFVGIEREQFLTGADGSYAPNAQNFLNLVGSPKWTYELSACQVESRTDPQKDLSAIKLELLENENHGNQTAYQLCLRLKNMEVGDSNMPLTVYSDPRYLEIAKTITKERLEAACRVTGTHIHLGVRDIEHAITLNNILVPFLDILCSLGDHSNGERIRLYKTMAKNWEPMKYESSEHFFEIAQAEGFTDNPRNCWKLIRISIHGTVELRMFGVADNIDEILEWVSFVKSIISEAL